MNAIILAAGAGTRMLPLTEKTPKCLLQVGGRSMIDHQIRCLKEVGVVEEDIVVVSGFRAEDLYAYLGPRITYVHNEAYATSNSLYSFARVAGRSFPDGFFLFNCDIVFDCRILSQLLETPWSAVAVDFHKKRANGEMNVEVDSRGRILEISKSVDAERAQGESVQIAKFNGEGGRVVLDTARRLIDFSPENRNLFPTSAYGELVRERLLHAVDIRGAWWMEIDTLDDYQKANEDLKTGTWEAGSR